MAKRGRKKTPSSILVKKGTDRADRQVAEMEIVLLQEVPTPPKAWAAAEKRRFTKICQQLIYNDLLDLVGLDWVEIYVFEMARYYLALDKLSEEGFIIVTAGGLEKPSPWFAILKDSFKNAQAISSQFGFTPSARAGIDMNKLKQTARQKKRKGKKDDRWNNI